MNPHLFYVVLPLLQVGITERDLGIKMAKTLPNFFFPVLELSPRVQNKLIKRDYILDR